MRRPPSVTSPRVLPRRYGAPLRVRDVRRPAELLAILLHHRAEHLLAGFQAEPEERGAGIGENVEQRQRQLHRGDGWGRERFPGERSCATLLHRRLPSEGCGDHRPTGRQKEPPLLFSADQFNRRRDIPLDEVNLGKLGLTPNDVTVRGVPGAYEVTHSIAILARRFGYDAIDAPSAVQAATSRTFHILDPKLIGH